MNLVVAADTHGPHPLSTDPTDIQLLVQECIQTNQMKFPNDQAPPGSAKMYSEFAKAINDAMEERDAKLVMHLVCRPYLQYRFGSNWFIARIREQEGYD